jgi:NADPH:quinone reductase-like Zn-dependent oxidoreductase
MDMMALRAHPRGGPEQLVCEQAPVPVPQPGEFAAAEGGRFEDEISGVDVVIDTVGGQMTERSYTVMRPGGRLVTLGAPPAADAACAHGVHTMFFVVAPDPGELAHLAGLVDQGRLRPVVSQVYPLGEGRRAFESGSQPRPPGKTVLTVR